MSTSFNRSSTYNRTYEKRIIEECPTIRIGGPPVQHSILQPGNVNKYVTMSTSTTSSPMNLQQPASMLTGGHVSSITSNMNELTLRVDTAPFRAEDLKVSVVDQFVVVEASHPEREDELGYVERRFVRKFRLPNPVLAECVTSNLSSDGILTISAKAPERKIEDKGSRTIPIKVVTGSGSEVTDGTGNTTTFVTTTGGGSTTTGSGFTTKTGSGYESNIRTETKTISSSQQSGTREHPVVVNLTSTSHSSS
ncbi:hypothetical protein AB6A40_001178 [Gnathostoma spinigerum]|uniref:SHSP domain-containing protein n=1 Tax=Gnathostoma spinigerum TaxID=75299 RepID=A0ABD6E8H8_9BILA